VRDAAAEHEQEPEAALAAMPAPGAERAPASVERILGLQRTAGNRAVGRMLAREEASGDVDTRIEEKLIKPSDSGETTFHWNAKYAYEFTDDQVIGIVRLKMAVWPGVTDDEAKTARQEARSAFQKIFDDKFSVVEPGTWSDTSRRLRLGMDWVNGSDDGKPHATITLMPDAPSTSEQTNRSVWHVKEPAIVHAHETGHLFGLLDEYVDANVADRTDVGKSAVHDDHSIMGDYPNEGIAAATMKVRHAERIAKMIYKAAGRDGSKIKLVAKK